MAGIPGFPAISRDSASTELQPIVGMARQSGLGMIDGAHNRLAATWPVTKKSERLYRVTYTSRIRDSTFSVHDIVRRSKENNSRLGVGGVLQYNQTTGEITQILEGQENIVKGLLDKVSGDWRHCCFEIKQEEWPKKRVWHKWGGMLLSHGGHWKVVRSACGKMSSTKNPTPSKRLRPKRTRQKKRIVHKNILVVGPAQQDQAKVEVKDGEEVVVTPYGTGNLLSLERGGIMRIRLPFGIAHIHESKLVLPPKARPTNSLDGSESKAQKEAPKWTVALIDRSRYLNGEQHLMYVFTRKPVGLVFYPNTLKISETRMDATAAGIMQNDCLLEIDGKAVTSSTFKSIYGRTMVPFSMKFYRPKPSNCATCARATSCAIS
ncbi:hypothetical protein AAMO2058_001616000 [Amorphochlora amoebiformis]